MAPARPPALALVIAALAAAAAAETPPVRVEVAPADPAALQPWPYPAPDARDWWDGEWPKPAAARDPLGGRRLGRNARPAAVDNGIGPSLYRLWGLQPLQAQVLHGGEMVLEVWVRPARSVRQSVVRITVRRDGRAFVQARAGYACCEPQVARRVDIDAELEAGAAAAFLALREAALWEAPREVRVEEGGGASPAVCVDGTSYDLTLLVPGRARSLRRACDDAEIGQAAEVLEPAIRAALGRDPRFDILFPNPDFSAAGRAYRDLIDRGGTLAAAPVGRPQAPGAEAAPMGEAGD